MSARTYAPEPWFIAPKPTADDCQELILIGRGWLHGAPPSQPGAPDLLGFTGPVGFVCADCSGRIIGRGCQLRMLADAPLWKPSTAPSCALCGKGPSHE